MRQSMISSPLRGVGTLLLLGTVIAIGARPAHAQSGFFIGPGGIGFGYQDDNVGVIIGNSPYGRRYDDHHDRYHHDHYRQREYYQQERYTYEVPEVQVQAPEPLPETR